MSPVASWLDEEMSCYSESRWPTPYELEQHRDTIRRLHAAGRELDDGDLAELETTWRRAYERASGEDPGPGSLLGGVTA